MYNGFLLSANLDALFDNFLISFTDDCKLLVSDQITQPDRERLGLDVSMRLRWMAAPHIAYLQFHRHRFATQNLEQNAHPVHRIDNAANYDGV